jgi:hypothetical protein
MHIDVGYYTQMGSDKDYLLVAETTSGAGNLEGFLFDCNSRDTGLRVSDQFEISAPDRTVRRASVTGDNSGFLIAYESRLSGTSTWQRIYARKFLQPLVYLPIVIK